MYINTKLLQQFGCYCTGSYASDGFTSGGTSATPVITKTVFFIKGVICVSRAVVGCDITVIAGTLIGVEYDQRNGCTCSLALEDAG